ncbi:phosphotransferase family protein [Brachybacterium saurashtrense]|uniref:Aminoglycoside phosphotransferase family protein n=1 Tax=Brachybacterium saurashtrense TaxID=556288 RepID=A0A345YRC0_9MICO|nr:aminoglycoside phosphotransferase family protein [Brachybacterium saurashtrense]AXK46472.1 aminoglycoside phosphotransferase family protein [Brachybacterium saurashtrense]RRR24213.1 aminoglycoside phosphotransferase family protein [Brachybacterium saurashtrense]
MATDPPPGALTPLDPASPAMGERLVEVWGRGALVLPLAEDSTPLPLPGLHPRTLPPSLSGRARASLAGVGERFAAWRVSPQENASVIVRIAHVAPEELHQDLRHEIAALTLLPAEIGPAPIAVHADAAASPLGHPCVVTTDVRGVAAVPETWTGAHLHAHARLLARLHAVPAPGRGPVSLGEDPWAAVPAGAPQLLPEVEAEVRSWRERHGALLAEHGLEPFLERALEEVAGIEAQIAALDAFALCHGDLCTTNILWDGMDPATGTPRVQYIDFEWAQGDDPARDLAILGGSVHGGPWYVPLDEPQVAAFVDAYLAARAELGEVPAAVADRTALRERMRAWTAYERTAMLVHVASRATTRASHRRVLPVLRATLAAELGLPD